MISSLIIHLVFSYLLSQTFFPSFPTDTQIIRPKISMESVNIFAKRGVVLDSQDRVFLFSKDSNHPQAIASITKLMTALVFLEHNPGWDKVYKITQADIVSGGKINLFRGDRVTIRNLFNLSLIASDNGATLALVHATKISEKEFVALMNNKAKVLGLDKTSFSDPIGLGDHNVSSAKEVAFLAQEAFKNKEILNTVHQNSYSFITKNGKEESVFSTDKLLSEQLNNFRLLGGKTGYTDQAGYSFVGLFAVDNKQYISVVLNSDTRQDRFLDTKKIVSWVLNNYK